ncbi:MAG: hypothetical protein AB7T37_06010 [Dehalococcoidia bacterium]
MSAIMFQRYSLRPGADRAELGQALLDSCRYIRSLEGCLSARYFWADWNHAAVLSEYDAIGRPYSYAPTPDGARLGIRMADLANLDSTELMSGAREGNEAYVRGTS